jgi:hypothetical protein
MRAVQDRRFSERSESGPAAHPQDNSEGTTMKTETTFMITTLVMLAAADSALAHPGSGIAVDREGQVQARTGFRLCSTS